jgi:hypothetical protein
MATKIIKWKCTVCATEYHSEKAAISCEQSGLPPETAHIKVGDTVKYMRSVEDEGGIQTFKYGEGEVLHIVTTRNDKTNKHQSIFIVQCQDEKGVYEGVCSLLDISGSMEMYLASSPRYEVGFAAELKKGKENG